MDLAPAVIAEIVRLGGTLAPLGPRPAHTVETIAGWLPLPEPLRRFLDDVAWPTRVFRERPLRVGPVQFRSRDDEYPYGVGFGLTEIAGDYSNQPNRRPYVCIAFDGTQFMYFVALDDEDPTDPEVHRVDHEGDHDFQAGGGRLSAFLADLEPELDAGD